MSSVAAALQDVAILGIDTAPFIYLIERNPAFLPSVRAVFQRISAGAVQGRSSVITLAEVLTQPLRAGDVRLAQRYRRFLSRSRNLTLDPISAVMAARAADLRAR